jgi:hypothetical protein
MLDRRPSPSIYGIETEYSALLTFPGNLEFELAGSCHAADVELGLYNHPGNSGGSQFSDEQLNDATEAQGIYRNVFGMLSNGGRFYIDPSGFEYDTPETTTAEEAAHQTFNGDRFMQHVLEYLRKEEYITSYQLNRRIVDHNRSSRGIHLNTVTRLIDDESSYTTVMALATLNVAKGALFGSGGLLLKDNNVTEYHHSPRLSLTDNIFSHYSSYKKRPLVRKPFKKDQGGLWRVETITSDALSFGWPLRASMVATNAVIGLIEMGYVAVLPKLHAATAVQSAQNVGQYGAEGVVELEKDDKPQQVMSLDVIRHIAEIVLEADELEDFLDTESKQVIPEIIEVADLAAKDTDLVVRDVESVARLAAMERRMEETKSTLGSERICRFDYKWDQLGGGIAETLRFKGSVGWRGFSKTAPSHSQAAKRLKTPPQDTRARIRGAVIEVEQGTDSSTWDCIETHELKAKLHPLQHDMEAFAKEHDL